jgi:hypothetical protein
MSAPITSPRPSPLLVFALSAVAVVVAALLASQGLLVVGVVLLFTAAVGTLTYCPAATVVPLIAMFTLTQVYLGG